MRRTVFALGAAAFLLVATSAAASRPDRATEPSRAKDYSRDFQVPAAPDAPDAVVLSESFDAGIPGGWTVIDNAGSGVVWTNLAGCGEGNYVNASADVACVSSDDAGTAEFDTELRTPALDLSTYVAPASLTFDANYQNFLNLDFLEVDVSTNGGGAWTNLLSWNEDHGSLQAPPGVPVNLDVSAYAGQASVIFRFHYFDPNSDDYDWYAQVDNVVVNASVAGCTLTLTCPADQTAAAPPGSTGASVVFPDPVVGGTCEAPTVDCAPASGDFFPIGTTAVACTAVEGATSANCAFDVTVGSQTLQEIPTASSLGLAALALLLAGAALSTLRRGA